MRFPACVLITALLLAAGNAASQTVDYGVYFWPAPGSAAIDRQFAIVYNAGQAAGTHPYKLTLRAFAPDGTLACETTTTIRPWPGRSTMKKAAWFEALYSNKSGRMKVRPGKYLLRAYLTEQIASGQQQEDANLSNNQYPFEPPEYLPIEFEVRPGADEIRCAVPAALAAPESLPPGYNPPTRLR